jgi:hypothetical protein
MPTGIPPPDRDGPSASFGSEGSLEEEFPEYSLLLREDQIQLSQPVLFLLDLASEDNTISPTNAAQDTHTIPITVKSPMEKSSMATEATVSPVKSSLVVPTLAPAYDLLLNANHALQQGILRFNEEKSKAELKQQDYERRLGLLDQQLFNAEAYKKELEDEITSLQAKVEHLLAMIELKDAKKEENGVSAMNLCTGSNKSAAEPKECHPWATLSDTALSRKTKAELVNFLSKRVRKYNI